VVRVLGHLNRNMANSHPRHLWRTMHTSWRFSLSSSTFIDKQVCLPAVGIGISQLGTVERSTGPLPTKRIFLFFLVMLLLHSHGSFLG